MQTYHVYTEGRQSTEHKKLNSATRKGDAIVSNLSQELKCRIGKEKKLVKNAKPCNKWRCFDGHAAMRAIQIFLESDELQRMANLLFLPTLKHLLEICSVT